MTFKDLKPGMKVWIREDLEVETLYGRYYFVDEMRKLVGLQTIVRLTGIWFNVENDDVEWCFTNEMVDWKKTEQLNKKETKLTYDGTTLEGQIDGQEIKVVKSSKDKEDLEKAIMMGLLKSLGYNYGDIKNLQSKIKKEWKPVYGETYYYIGFCGEVRTTRSFDYDWDNSLLGAGNCFRTEEEAEKKAIEVRKIFKK